VFYWIYDIPTESLAILFAVAFVGFFWAGCILLRPFLRLFVRSRSGSNEVVGYVLSWMSNGEQIISQEDTWDDGPQGRKAVKVSNNKGLPTGEYHLVLGIGGRVALEGKVMVGTPVDESDSEVSGRIVDGRSQQPVSGAAIMVLKPDAALRDFLRTQNQSALFTSTESDSSGRFKLPKQLPKGQAYSLVVAARGYQPASIDRGLRVSAAAPEQADIGDLELLPGF
jgi:hypothetical protein